MKQGNVTVDYAKVSARVAEFLKDNKNASIATTYEFKEGWVIFKATVYPDAEKQSRVFHGTSLGKVGAIKAFEKLETIAVGRALAFAGYLSDGEIASDEEMDKFHDTPGLDDESKLNAIANLESTSNKEELHKAWVALTQAQRNDGEIQALKDKLKEKYETIQVGTADGGVAETTPREDNGDRVKEPTRNASRKG